MTLWFLAFLAVAWIVVYLPSVWRARQSSPLPAAQRFKRRMRMMSPRATAGLSAGRWIVVPNRQEQLARRAAIHAQRRRTYVLSALVAAAIGTGIWAVLEGGVAIEVNLVVDAAAAFYVALLLDAKQKRAERALKVRALGRREARPAEHPEPALEVLEAGGSGRS